MQGHLGGADGAQHAVDQQKVREELGDSYSPTAYHLPSDVYEGYGYIVAMVTDTASGQSKRHDVGAAVVGGGVGAGVGGTEIVGSSVGAGVGTKVGAVVVKRVKLATFVW